MCLIKRTMLFPFPPANRSGSAAPGSVSPRERARVTRRGTHIRTRREGDEVGKRNYCLSLSRCSQQGPLLLILAVTQSANISPTALFNCPKSSPVLRYRILGRAHAHQNQTAPCALEQPACVCIPLAGQCMHLFVQQNTNRLGGMLSHHQAHHLLEQHLRAEHKPQTCLIKHP